MQAAANPLAQDNDTMTALTAEDVRAQPDAPRPTLPRPALWGRAAVCHATTPWSGDCCVSMLPA